LETSVVGEKLSNEIAYVTSEAVQIFCGSISSLPQRKERYGRLIKRITDETRAFLPYYPWLAKEFEGTDSVVVRTPESVVVHLQRACNIYLSVRKHLSGLDMAENFVQLLQPFNSKVFSSLGGSIPQSSQLPWLLLGIKKPQMTDVEVDATKKPHRSDSRSLRMKSFLKKNDTARFSLQTIIRTSKRANQKTPQPQPARVGRSGSVTEDNLRLDDEPQLSPPTPNPVPSILTLTTRSSFTLGSTPDSSNAFSAPQSTTLSPTSSPLNVPFPTQEGSWQAPRPKSDRPRGTALLGEREHKDETLEK
jgi:hypothetical protein